MKDEDCSSVKPVMQSYNVAPLEAICNILLFIRHHDAHLLSWYSPHVSIHGGDRDGNSHILYSPWSRLSDGTLRVQQTWHITLVFCPVLHQNNNLWPQTKTTNLSPQANFRRAFKCHKFAREPVGRGSFVKHVKFSRAFQEF